MLIVLVLLDNNKKKLESGGSCINTLIVVPTNELADQVYREALRLSDGKKLKLCVLKKSLYTKAISSQVSSNSYPINYIVI